MHSIIEKYCTEEWRDFVNFHSKVIKVEREKHIFSIGDDVKGLYFIQTGKVKIMKRIPSGKTRIIRLAADGDIIGHRGFGGTWEYSITAQTLEDTELLFIPLNIFDQTVKANPDFGFFMMMFFAEELRNAEKLSYQCPVKNLVASSLYNSLKIFGLKKDSTELAYTLSRKDIASMVGTTYESVIRSLSELQKEGIIRIDGKKIHVLDRKSLKQSSGVLTPLN